MNGVSRSRLTNFLVWYFQIFVKIMSIEIKLRKRRAHGPGYSSFEKSLDREGVIRDVRAKRYFEKPSDKKRKARKVAAFTQMLRTRYEKM